MIVMMLMMNGDGFAQYSYAPAAQLIGIDGYGDANLQTQV